MKRSKAAWIWGKAPQGLLPGTESANSKRLAGCFRTEMERTALMGTQSFEDEADDEYEDEGLRADRALTE